MSEYVTKDKYEAMKAELHTLKTKDRLAASEAIAEARAKGDLRENAEYDSAKEYQGFLEARIKKLENALVTVKIIDTSNIDTSKASILTFVTFTNVKTKAIDTFQLVGEKEQDIKMKKLSINTPIGKALLGKQVGDIVIAKVPAGDLHLRIDKIFI